MRVFHAICYTFGMISFFIAVFRHKMNATTLDYMALGLFFVTIPFVVKVLAPFV